MVVLPDLCIARSAVATSCCVMQAFRGLRSMFRPGGCGIGAGSIVQVPLGLWGWRGPDLKLSRQALVWAYGAPPPPTSPKSQPMPPPRRCFASLQKSSSCNQTQKTTRFSRSAGATKASALQTADQHVHRPRSHAASRSDSAKEGGQDGLSDNHSVQKFSDCKLAE